MLLPKLKIGGQSKALGFAMALGAGSCYGATNVIGKWVVDEYSHPFIVSVYALLFGMVIMLAIAHTDVPRAVARSRRSLLPIVLAGACSGAGVTFTYFALSRTEVVIAAPIISSAPLFTLLLAYLVLRGLERVTWQLILGTLMIVGGIILVVFGR